MLHYNKCEYIKENLLKKRIKSIVSFIIYRLCLLRRSERPAHDPPENSVAIVFLGALGDMVVLCGAAKKLKEAGKTLTLICKTDNEIAQFAQISCLFDEIIKLDIRGLKRFKHLSILHRMEFDTVFCAPLGRHILPDIYACAIKAEHRYFADTLQDCTSLRLKKASDKKADKLVSINSTHELDRYSEFVKACGFTDEAVEPFILSRPAQQRNKILAIFPGAGGGAQKRWHAEKFADVAKALTAEGLVSEVLILGNEADLYYCNKLYELLFENCNVRNLCAQTTISKLCDILSGCCLTLVNDSGGAHISVACKTPVIVISGMWQYGRFYPNLHCDGLVSVSDEQRFCQSCNSSRPLCCVSPAPCIENIDEAEILKQARLLIGRIYND